MSLNRKSTSMNMVRNVSHAAWCALLLLVQAFLPRATLGDQKGDFLFNIVGTEASIIGYTGPGGEVVLPDRIGSAMVTSISGNLFSWRTNVTSVTLPESLTNIGESTFYACTSLRKVTIPKGVNRIDDAAFAYCQALAAIDIPDSVTSIGSWAFVGCSSLNRIAIPHRVIHVGSYAFADCGMLQEIEVTPESPTLSSLEGVLLDKSQTQLLAFPGGKAGFYAIPNSVTSIEIAAFYLSTNVTDITIPNSIRHIGYQAFGFCSGLTNITMADGITGLDALAFVGCSRLTDIIIPDSVVSIGDGAFSGCTHLLSATVGTGISTHSPGNRRIAPAGGCGGGGAIFGFCPNLASLMFKGDPPPISSCAWLDSRFAIVFYQPGTLGWPDTLWGYRTVALAPRPEFSDWILTTGLAVQFPDAIGKSDDPDGDEVSNYDEWLADTDPTQRSSRLTLELGPRLADLSVTDRTAISEDQYPIYFRSVPGRYYGVQQATCLDGSWELQATKMAANGTTQSRILLPRPDFQAFYRILTFP